MKIRQRMMRVLLAALLILPGLVHADVIYPALDIQDLVGTDSGVSLTTGTFNINATVLGIATNGTGGFIDLPDQNFSLTSTGTYAGGSGAFSGSFVVGGGLLTGTFTNLSVMSLGGDYASFGGAVSYTGGTMQGSFTGGNITGSIAGANVIAKLGTVVPVPAAIWLFGSGLIGFIAVARRKSV
jgi:hypothetical protein